MSHMQPMGTQYVNSLQRDELASRFPGLLEAILKAKDPDIREDTLKPTRESRQD